jgi:hypothetical protein
MGKRRVKDLVDHREPRRLPCPAAALGLAAVAAVAVIGQER